jgi:hypothetical protein
MSPLIAFDIRWIIGVLTAVDLDDKPSISANEIDDERSDGLLTNKTYAHSANASVVDSTGVILRRSNLAVAAAPVES